MNLKYLAAAILTFPLLPLMYFQGKRIRSRIPTLPEASGEQGICHPSIKTQRLIRLATIGESTIAGVGVETHEEGFTGTLAKELSHLWRVNIEWRVYARSGYTARNVTKRLVPRMEEDRIDLIVIGLGGNDAFKLNPPSKWKKDIEVLIHSLRSRYPQCMIVFCNMPPIKEFPAFTPLIKFTVGNLVEWLGSSLQKTIGRYEHVFYSQEKITLEDWIRRLNTQVKKSDFFSDGVHPSKLTYQTWAKDIAEKILGEPNIRKGLIKEDLI